jgi:hypothetical protein
LAKQEQPQRQEQSHTADCTIKHRFARIFWSCVFGMFRLKFAINKVGLLAGKVRLIAKSAMAKEDGGKEKGVKEKIVAAIRRAAEELGRAPSRGELRRITGVSHYRVLAEFATLRDAVRAAGLEPNPKGEKISTEDLLADWKRVAEKLGGRPSRAEYVREGKYSAGVLTVRFGSWGNIGRKIHHGDGMNKGASSEAVCSRGKESGADRLQAVLVQ